MRNKKVIFVEDNRIDAEFSIVGREGTYIGMFPYSDGVERPKFQVSDTEIVVWGHECLWKRVDKKLPRVIPKRYRSKKQYSKAQKFPAKTIKQIFES